MERDHAAVDERDVERVQERIGRPGEPRVDDVLDVIASGERIDLVADELRGGVRPEREPGDCHESTQGVKPPRGVPIRTHVVCSFRERETPLPSLLCQ